MSAIQTDYKSHSYVHLRWTSSSTPNKIRIRYGTTTAYEGSAGGGIELYGDAGTLHATSAASVTGLAPSTLYHFCPQSSTDGGSTWSTCVDHTETTDALPAVHPALPEAPADWDTSYPDTTGYTTRNANCADLQTHIDAAATAQTTAGSIIVLAAGSVCDSTSYELKSDSAVKSFAAAAVNTTTDAITLTSHGYSEGQAIRLSSSNPINTNAAIWPPQNSGLIAGSTYYVRNPDTDTFQLASTVDGTPIDFTATGSGTHYIRAWPPPSNWIIITSDAMADLPPDGVRVTPEWASKMVTFKPAGRRGETHQAVFTQGMLSGGTNLAHHYYFRGVEFSTKDTATAEMSTTENPYGYYGHIETYHDASNVVFNQCYFHRAAHPNRISRFFYLGGAYMVIENSHLEGQEWWFTMREGLLGARVNDAQMTISQGSFYLGSSTRTTTGTVTLDITGGSSSVAGKVYFAMDGTLVFNLPTGMTANCSGGGVTCSVVTAAEPAYPANGEGRIAAAPLGTITFTSGVLSAFAPAWTDDYEQNGLINDFGESSSSILGLGPGPYKIENNYSSGAGVVWHFDDGMATGESPWFPRGYIIRRNRFVFPTYAITGHPDTNNLRYPSRHLMEWKNGSHIEIVGNSFENNPYDGTPVAAPLVIMPQAGGRITDVRVAYNLFSRGAGGLSVMGQAQGYGQEAIRKAAPPVERTLIEHNIFDRIDAYTYKGNRQAADGSSIGFTIDARSALEDYTVRNNTTFDMRGTNTFFMRTGPVPTEGMSITDNVMTNGDYSQSIYVHSMTGSEPTFTGSNVGKNAMDQQWRRGVGTTSYTFSGNALIPWYSDSSVPSGITSASTHCTNFGGTYSGGCSGSILGYLATGADVAANIAAMKWFDSAGDLRKRIDSPFISGAGLSASGLGIGADWDENRRQRGEIYNQRNIGTTVAATVPDPGAACYVMYGAGTDPLAWTTTAANTDATRTRTITASGLIAGDHFRVVCAGTYQPADAVAQ